MRRTATTSAGILVTLILLLGMSPLMAGALPARLGDGRELPSLAPVLEPILPAVVNISTRSRVRVRKSPLFDDPFFRHFFDLPERPRERVAQSLGSGVVIDATRGYVITNHHVVDKADEITVTLQDGRVLQAHPVGADTDTDIAVIQVPAEHITAIPLGDSDQLRVGDFVAAIGNPFGLGQTVTSGIVSALGRSGLGIEGYENFIQTDASINPGNSGGALVDLRGELIGINTAILAPNGGNIGIGFAIPINMARQVVTQLTEYGRMRRGSLGVQLQDLTPELASAFGIPPQGAVIAKVTHGSSADQAGLRVGDVVIGINGHPVHSGHDLRNNFGILPVGAKAELRVLRDGRPVQLAVRVAEPRRETLAGEQLDARLRGAVFGSIEEESSSSGDTEGVMVVKVTQDSAAANVGLQEGDLLVAINRQPIHNLDELRRLGRMGGKNLLLNIHRGDASFLVLLQQ
ncbi:Periplasmic serine endoprotease DegP [Gammaproteobacteria bacterium]